jgi:uncharacterized protein DUF3943
MRLTTLRFTGPLLLAGSLITASRASAQDGEAAVRPAASFLQASAGVVAVNGLTWAYNWYVQHWHWANVGTRAWWKNLRDGFVWDDDAFMDNQLAHPYHGSLYFNAARGSGYGFWGSTGFVAAGSLGWELLTENVRPSLNDLINTTLGGIALGEVTFRLSSFLASAGRRTTVAHEAGAFVLSPVGRAQGLLSGRERRSSIFGQHRPESGGAWIAVGRRKGTADSPNGTIQERPFVGLTLQYGSPFDERISRPFDAFEFSLQFSPEQTGVITHAAVSGLLARSVAARSSRSQLLLGLFHHFDYDELPAFKASSQSVSGALLYRRRAGSRTDIALGLHLEALPLGAISSEYNHYRQRDYDYGPGLGGRITGSLQHDGRDLVRLDGRVVWIHSLYGADGNHVATTARVSATLPVVRMIGVGGDVGLTFRRSVYRDQPRVLKRIPQLRAYLVWSPS